MRGPIADDGSVDAIEVHVEDARQCAGIVSSEPSYYGRLERLPDDRLGDDWTVAGRRVHVSGSSRLHQERGPVAAGACVEVHGSVNADNSINASEIEIHSSSGGCDGVQSETAEVKFYGVAQEGPQDGPLGAWRIAGRQVAISATTDLLNAQGKLAPGACFEVEGQVQRDDSIVATRVKLDDDASCGLGL